MGKGRMSRAGGHKGDAPLCELFANSLDQYFEDLDEKSTIEILDSLIKDKPLRPGSYRGRQSSAPEKKRLKNGENYA